jgi:hypothetical protein
MANPEHLAKLREGVEAWNRWRLQNPKLGINLSQADLTEAMLWNANLSGANLNFANLNGASLSNANLERADLFEANLFGSSLEGANLSGAHLSYANLSYANFHEANLAGACLAHTNLNEAKLADSDMTDVDLRSANLHRARLDKSIATGIQLWEAQRAGWSIKAIVCERAFWDADSKEPVSYAPGEFEKLYSDQTCIELFYQGGVSTFELNTLPALLHHLASLHPGANIRLKSVEETGGGAKISIVVGDADQETTEKIKADAMQVYHAQLALRDKEMERLQIEKQYIEGLFFAKLIPAMLTAGTPQNVFQGPVTGVVIASGQSKVDFHQTVNDNTAILALLEKIMDRHAALGLHATETAELETALRSATAELQKKHPDKSVLSKSLAFIQKLATEAATKAAGKLGEAAVTDWQSWLHQLAQLAHHLK